LPLFDRALGVAPDRHEIRLNRAIALQAMGNSAAAIAAYDDFLLASRADSRFATQRQTAQRLRARLASGSHGVLSNE
jgi:hypothetical protein